MLFSELRVGEFFYHVNKDQLLFKIEETLRVEDCEGGYSVCNAVIIHGQFKGYPTFMGDSWEVERVAYTKKDIVTGARKNYGDYRM
jgi:hypothetical protein